MAAPRPQRSIPGERRPAAEGGRAEFVAGPKKGAHPALLLGLLGLVVVTGGVLGWAVLTKGKEPKTIVKDVETDNVGEWAGIRADINEAQRRKDATMKLRLDDSRYEEFQTMIEETMDFIAGVQMRVDEMLDPVRGEDGSIGPEYEGYLAESRRLTMMFEDLNKSSGF